MKKISILVLSLLLACNSTPKPPTIVEKNGLHYEENSTTPYTGTVEYFHPDEGHKSAEHTYKEGKYHGTWKIWDGKDTLFIENNFQKGTLQGEQKVYLKSGAVSHKSVFKDGVLIEQKSWNENGSLNHETVVKDGVVQKYINWSHVGSKDEKQRVISEYIHEGEKLKVIEFKSDGSKTETWYSGGQKENILANYKPLIIPDLGK